MRKTTNDLPNNDSPGSPPDDPTCDPLTLMQTRLSSYVARHRDSLDAPFIKTNPDDPDGLTHKIRLLASHIDQCLGLMQYLSYSPDRIESIDQDRREGGFDARWGLIYTDIEDLPYQSLFVSHDPTAPDSDSEDPPEDPPGGTQI